MNPTILKLISAYLEANDQTSKNTALEGLWGNFQPLVISLMRKYYVPVSSQEDVYQDAFIQLLEAANSYDPKRGVPFESYYKARLSYWFLNQIRKKTELLTIDQDWASGFSLSDLMESTIGNCQELAELNESQSTLQKALQLLTLKQKQAVIMYYIHDLPLKEIAQKMGCSYGVACKHKDAGLKKIRNYWH